MHEYNADSIIIPNFPQLSQIEDGRWQRIWEMKLVSTPTSQIDIGQLERSLSNEEIEVAIKLENQLVKVKVITIRWGLEDDLIGYSYKIFKYLNDNLGELSEIQGQKRDTWAPWRWGEINSGRMRWL
jgi:hypothetical protein